ncbi:hypothetical protein PT281_03295 [Lactobacillus sp. ESL0701]|uniref:hypothetical protein n=1 Tax=Lactobacillus sp. ESL0701 TaxID=2983217 RepID=UPI0023F6E13E|nr:hypothetical protein [Lactobacillus sp. ESL0701]MDF7672287.1 hypothetical protein [Lactobacillus sp. ESL0701]
MYASISFAVVMLFIMIGEWVSSLTNAYVPSVFITAVLFAVGFWTFLPKNVVAKASFGPDFANICISLLLVHLGTLMNLKELIQQWKAVCISLLGVAGTLLLTLTIGTKIFDWHTVIAAVPPLTGGLVSALLMTNGLKAAGITSLVALPIAMFVMHSVVGYPLTAWMLKREGRRVAGEYHKGNIQAPVSVEEVKKENGKKGGFKLPAEYHTAAFILVKVAFVALLANWFSSFLKTTFNFDLNANVVCLIFGVIAHQLGFLEDSALNKANVFQWLMYGLLAYVFSQLSITTPQIIGKVFVQIIVLMLLGLLGMFLASAILAKPFGMSPEMAFACSLTSLFGFPADYILTTEICHNVAKDKEEEAVLVDQILPKMLVGGFATVSVASVIIASIFLKLL